VERDQHQRNRQSSSAAQEHAPPPAMTFHAARLPVSPCCCGRRNADTIGTRTHDFTLERMTPIEG
jgi:hypothetical protein